MGPGTVCRLNRVGDVHRYKSNDEVSKCSYDLDADTGVAKMHRCDPAEVGSNLTYSGTDPKVCQITVPNVGEAENATWATRLGDEMGRSSCLT